jgi:hypothetical protein
MSPGQSLTLWSVRVACVLYAAALAAWLTHKPSRARALWTLGLLAFLSHVAAAFSSYHGWSHRAAYEATASRTGEMFGVYWGGGLYFNYVFAAVWTADVGWMWLDGRSYKQRPKWVSAVIHTFLAFMFLNGAIVFASGWIRWVAVAMMVALGVLLMKR